MPNGLAQEALSSSLKQLKNELAAMRRGDRLFLARYRKARLRAFQLEFLAKFLRKSKPANKEIFERLHGMAKELEDRLGEFNETDEMLDFCRARQVYLPGGVSGVTYYEQKRAKALKALKAWLINDGWYESAPTKIASMLDDLEPLDAADLREAAIKKMVKVLRELQTNADGGFYSPKKKGGYVMSEVEPKVHELRREIRKIPMYASYLKGAFVLSDRAPLTKAGVASANYFRPLLKSPLAKTEFAHLPPARPNPISLGRPFFLAITKYVAELGFAKDWAYSLQSMIEVGVPGEVSFDQLDPSLKDVTGVPVPFNLLVHRTLDEIQETQIFRHMAEDLESQR